MKSLIYFLSLFLISQSVTAQKHEVHGQVTESGTPIPGAIIRVKAAATGTVADTNGNYSLELDEGTYTLVFSFGNSKEVEIDLDRDMRLDVDLQDADEVLPEVFVSSLRVNAESPITHSNLSNEEIENRNLGQDIPSLLNYLPGVVTTSDAGAGIGYTNIRVRGSDATRINVTINGVPYNDSESHGAFWVNLGDFASSVENLQLQRGVGTSTNGAGAFGGSMNFMTDRYRVNPEAEVSASVGSYNTQKTTVKFSTGLLNDHWEVSGRLSRIKSDGYIDRGWSNLKSYFLQGTYVNGGTLIKALTFGGKQSVYQAWDGIDAQTLETNRRYNPAGAYEDEQGNIQFYDNHTDNYEQDNFQLLWNQDLGSNWSSNLALHMTLGEGYYESYRPEESLSEYGIEPFMANGEMMETSDLVTRKWLDNIFYGATFSLNYQDRDWDVIFGGGINRYEGDHFGDIVYARFAPLDRPQQRYYENVGYKDEFNFYTKATYVVNEKLSLFGDLQIRITDYVTEGFKEEQEPFEVDENHTFFNPKAGLTYRVSNQSSLYFSFARAHREPNRDDYENGAPEPEELNDYELGWRFKRPGMEINSNLYFMDYRNQLVLTGELDHVGAFIRANSGKSYRLGLEIDAAFRLAEKWTLRPNIALSRNQNVDFVAAWDGEPRNFGDTEISYSPSVVGANILEYQPLEQLELRLLSKYVGEQYMSNTEAEGSKLDAYFVNDFNIQYTWKNAPLFEEVIFTGLVNNIFNEKYVSNGYFYTYDVEENSGVTTYGGAGYYPQAETNYLLGVTLKF